MLKRIIQLKGIGLFADACGAKGTDLSRLTLVHAENARGKTTFAAVLRSWGLNDGERLKARLRFDHDGEPSIHFLFEQNGNKEAKLVDWAWTAQCGGIEVFDAEFVDDSVYSGGEVDAKHRQGLLDFALGSASVAIKRGIDECDQNAGRAARDRTAASNAIEGYAKPYAVPDFIAASVPADLDKRLAEAQTLVTNLDQAAPILARPNLSQLELLTFDVGGYFETLEISLEDMETDAETLIRKHIETCAGDGVEAWLQEGLSHEKEAKCPYCGQSLEGIALVRAYRSYFNDAYRELKEKVKKLGDKATSSFGELVAAGRKAVAEKNASIADGWKPQVEIAVDELDSPELQKQVDSARAIVTKLSTEKQLDPLTALHSESDRLALDSSIQAFNSVVAEYNAGIEKHNLAIAAFRKGLETGSTSEAKTTLARLKTLKNRNVAKVQGFIDEFTTQDKKHGSITNQKKELQKQLKEVAPKVLRGFATEINTLLTCFGTEFQIANLAEDNAGGRPQARYALKFGAALVPLGTKEASRSSHAFGSTLSEGDKRTLAFAFFVAKMRRDPELKQKVIVIDDPISSFDRGRQRATIKALTQLASGCKQMLVFSHDPRFLRSLRKKLLKMESPAPPVASLCIWRLNEGVEFCECDINRLAESGYIQKRRKLESYVERGKPPADQAVRLIREVLEGFLKMKYPSQIDEDWSLGHIICKIDLLPSPCKENLNAHRSELRKLNNDVKPLAHGGNEDEQLGVEDSEVKVWAQSALNLIYKGL